MFSILMFRFFKFFFCSLVFFMIFLPFFIFFHFHVFQCCFFKTRRSVTRSTGDMTGNGPRTDQDAARPPRPTTSNLTETQVVAAIQVTRNGQVPGFSRC